MATPKGDGFISTRELRKKTVPPRVHTARVIGNTLVRPLLHPNTFSHPYNTLCLMLMSAVTYFLFLLSTLLVRPIALGGRGSLGEKKDAIPRRPAVPKQAG
jgi:hypothetical protein